MSTKSNTCPGCSGELATNESGDLYCVRCGWDDIAKQSKADLPVGYDAHRADMMTLDEVLIMLRNELVGTWMEHTSARADAWRFRGYDRYNVSLDALDPDAPGHATTFHDAVAVFRLAVQEIGS